MKLRIREATEADFPAIHELMRQVHQLHLESRPDIYRDIDPLTEEYYHTMLSDSIVLLALDGEKTAGFCVFQIRPTFANPLLIPHKVAFMDDLCVHKDYRRKGIGKQLFEAACQMANGMPVGHAGGSPGVGRGAEHTGPLKGRQRGACAGREQMEEKEQKERED